MAIRAGGEPSLALMSVGSDSPARGEPLLRWRSPENPMSTLFTLNDATESMEQESLDVGVAFVLEALDHAQGALCDVVVPFWLGIHLTLLLAFFFLYIFFVF